MLGGVNLMGEGFQCVRRLAAHAGLTKVGAAIDLGIDPMDGAAGFGDASIPSLTDAIKSGEGWEEARVEVDDSAGEGFEEGSLNHPHEASEDDEVYLCGLQGFSPGLFALRGELRLEGAGVEEAGGDAVLRAQFEHLAGGDIAPKTDHLGLAQATFGLGAEDCVGVGAATGTEEGDAHEGKVSA